MKLCASLSLCLMAVSLPVCSGTQQTILFEDFELGFQDRWQVGDADPAGAPAFWDDVSGSLSRVQPYSGERMAYCAGAGYDQLLGNGELFVAANFISQQIQTSQFEVQVGSSFVFSNPEHWAITGDGGGFSGTFTLPRVGIYELQLRHLSSSANSCPGAGFSPVTIRINEAVIQRQFDPAQNLGGEHGWVTDSFLFVGNAGKNSVSVVGDGMCSHYWIQALSIWRPLVRYQDSMRAYMFSTVDLTGFQSATVDFRYVIPSIQRGDKCRVFIDADLIGETDAEVGGWRHAIIKLDQYVGKSRVLRFEFVSNDDGNTGEGWYLDDIRVTGPKTKPTFTVTATAGMNGIISPSGNTSVIKSNNLTFRATPDSGYMVDKWSLNGTVVQMGGIEYSLLNVQDSASVLVTFKPIDRNDLRGHWGFDEPTGPTALDSSGYGNYGAITGNATRQGGKIGNALTFDGASGFVQINDSASLNTPTITLAAWINASSTDGNRRILQKGLNDSQFWLIFTGGRLSARFIGVSPEAIDVLAPSVGAWHHVAATYDGTLLRLFIDGIKVKEQSASGSIVSTSDPLMIGTKQGSVFPVDYFNGSIDDVRIYGRALSLEEIAELAGVVPPPTRDLLFQHDDGTIAVWAMRGAERQQILGFSPNNPGDRRWRLVSSTDWDKDRKQDLLWQHDDGNLAAWFMDGLRLSQGILLTPANPGDQNWRAAGICDLNSDRESDVIFQHQDGTLAVWLMNGTYLAPHVGGAQLLTPSHPGDRNWRIVGCGDIDGDGRPDLIFQHSDSSLAVWLMNGTNLREARLLNPSRAPGWRVVAVTDLSGDGKPELVFQHTDSTLALWTMNGTILIASEFMRPDARVGTGWKVVGPK